MEMTWRMTLLVLVMVKEGLEVLFGQGEISKDHVVVKEMVDPGLVRVVQGLQVPGMGGKGVLIVEVGEVTLLNRSGF